MEYTESNVEYTGSNVEYTGSNVEYTGSSVEHTESNVEYTGSSMEYTNFLYALSAVPHSSLRSKRTNKYKKMILKEECIILPITCNVLAKSKNT